LHHHSVNKPSRSNSRQRELTRESAIHLYACSSTAGPRYSSWFHQYDGTRTMGSRPSSRRSAQEGPLINFKFSFPPSQANSSATPTKNTLVQSVKLLPVLRRLQELSLSRRVVVLEVRLYRLVLIVKLVGIGTRSFATYTTSSPQGQLQIVVSV
jgi:hypothetical protein